MGQLKACCKINLGLRVVGRRGDGFHDIETVMVPVSGFYDTVEVTAMPSESSWMPLTPPPYPPPRPVFPTASVLEVTGRAIDCEPEQNLCMRALRLMQREFGIGEAALRLHKRVPAGAGLGGGSSDAAAVLRGLSSEFALELSDGELEGLAARLGSDVPFFIRGVPELCTGRGEIMTPVEVALAGLWLALLVPEGVAISTAEAYRSVAVRGEGRGELSVAEIVRRDVGEWKQLLVNDFEQSIFARHPSLAALKAALYDTGALYASMSGSGSAIFGIFERRPGLGFGTPFESANPGRRTIHVEHFR